MVPTVHQVLQAQQELLVHLVPRALRAVQALQEHQVKVHQVLQERLVHQAHQALLV